MEKIRKIKEDRNNKKDSEEKDTMKVIVMTKKMKQRIFNNYREGMGNFNEENSQDTNQSEETETSSAESNTEKYKKISKENAKSFLKKAKKGKVRCSLKFRKILEFIYTICGYILKAFVLYGI